MVFAYGVILQAAKSLGTRIEDLQKHCDLFLAVGVPLEADPPCDFESDLDVCFLRSSCIDEHWLCAGKFCG